MVRHKSILQDAQGRMDGTDVSETILYRLADRGSRDIRTAARSGMEPPITSQRTEIRNFGPFKQRDVINMSRPVVVLRRPAVAGPISAHKQKL